MSFNVRCVFFLALAPAPCGLIAQAAVCVTSVTAPERWRDPRVRDSVMTTSSGAELTRDAVACEAPLAFVRRGDIRLAPPSLSLVWQSALANSRDDGAMWAGRGLSLLGRAGFYMDVARYHLAVVPEVWSAENRPFFVFPNPDPARSNFAHPFYPSPTSIDWPLRMGVEPIVQFGLGQSAAWYESARWSAGWSSSTMTWGPARTGLLLSTNAPGIPRVFARTTKPIATRAGLWSASWFVGDLVESRFFDRDKTNDRRNISFLGIGWTPGDSSRFSLGLARAAANVMDKNGGRDLTAPLAGRSPTTHDEMTSFFAEARDTDGRFRAWIELLHQGPLRLRELLTAPQAELGYTFGVEAASRKARGTMLYLLEFTSVEQPQTITDRGVHDFYTGYGTPQGWTNRGQLLGAAVGPGGQAQFFSADWAAATWFVGGLVERIRWNEDAMYRQYLFYPNRHDVSYRAAVRGGLTRGGVEYQAEYSWGRRLNYLFQNRSFISDYITVDIPFSSVSLSVWPAPRKKR